MCLDFKSCNGKRDLHSALSFERVLSHDRWDQPKGCFQPWMATAHPWAPRLHCEALHLLGEVHWLGFAMLSVNVICECSVYLKLSKWHVIIRLYLIFISLIYMFIYVHLGFGWFRVVLCSGQERSPGFRRHWNRSKRSVLVSLGWTAWSEELHCVVNVDHRRSYLSVPWCTLLGLRHLRSALLRSFKHLEFSYKEFDAMAW